MNREIDSLNIELSRIGTRLERMEEHLVRVGEKLDNHLERVSGAEKDISWMKGYIKIATTIFLASIGAIGTLFLNTIWPGTGK